MDDKELGINDKLCRQKMLAQDVAKALGITLYDARALIPMIFEMIKRRIVDGYRVEIADFGYFEQRTYIKKLSPVAKDPSKQGKVYPITRIHFNIFPRFKMLVSTSKKAQKLRRKKHYAEAQRAKEREGREDGDADE